MREVMHPMCWPDEGLSFELCCFFHFGPSLRGLPYHSEEPVVFQFRSVGQIKIRSMSVPGLWPQGWIFGRLLADVQQAKQQADALGWPEGAQKLARLPDRALNVLDVSCGAGLSSIVGAKRGHNVTSTDVSPELLHLAGRNAAENGVKLRLRQWDVQKAPTWPRPRTRFDLCLLDLAYFNLHFRHVQLGDPDAKQYPFIGQALPTILRNLQMFVGDCCVYVFGVVQSNGMKAIREGLPDEMVYSNFTVELLSALKRYNSQHPQDLLKDCGAAVTSPKAPLLRSPPAMSPLGWLIDAGWTPPIFYHLLLW